MFSKIWEVSRDRVREIIREMEPEWPSCSYHLTRNNCAHFAQKFLKKLAPDQNLEVPKWVFGAASSSTENNFLAPVVDGVWGAIKWGMTKFVDQRPSPVLRIFFKILVMRANFGDFGILVSTSKFWKKFVTRLFAHIGTNFGKFWLSNFGEIAKLW